MYSVAAHELRFDVVPITNHRCPLSRGAQGRKICRKVDLFQLHQIRGMLFQHLRQAASRRGLVIIENGNWHGTNEAAQNSSRRVAWATLQAHCPFELRFLIVSERGGW